MTATRRPAHLLVVLACVVLAGGACSDSDDGASGPTTSGAGPDTTTTTPARDPAVACEEGDGDLAPVDGADQVSEGAVDLDGDGTDDQVWVYSMGDDFRVRATLSADVSLDDRLPIEDRTAEPRVLGGHDIENDGTEELFFEAGRGAAAVVIGLVTLTEECRLGSVRAPDGSLARFPVGASAATQQGLACRNDRLVALSGETSDGRSFEWSAVAMELEGASLAVASTDGGTYHSPEDDEEIRRLGTFTCGDVTV